jgi:hypothetical protein
MSDHPTLEKCKRSDSLRAIDDLVWHHEVARSYFFLQAAYGAEGNDCAHTDRAKSGDVGAVMDLMGREFVVEAVTGEESDGDGFTGRGRGMVKN